MEISQEKKQLEELNKLKAASLKDDLLNSKEIINGITFVAAKLDLDAASMKNLAFELGKGHQDLFFIGGAENNGKAILTLYISKELAQERSLNAGNLVRELGKFIQGGGGGQPFFATAGGKNPSGIDQALEEAKKYLI